jgi:class 3 adenylate cyclase
MVPGIDLDHARLEAGLAALEAARAWSPRVVSRLETRIRSGEDLDLFRINPYRFASETSTPEAEAVDLFLHATHAGVFQMEWNLVCASCGNTARSFRTLARVDPHFVCEMCQMVNDPPLDEYIQVAFTISPDVRSIAYHDPESLSAEDRFFNYQVSRDIRPGSGPLTSLQVLRASTHLADYVEPGGSASVEFDFTGQALAIRDPLHAAAVAYLLEPGDGDGQERSTIRLRLDEKGLDDLDRTLEPLEFKLTERVEMRLLFPGASTLPDGPLTVSVDNHLAERASIWIVEYPEVPHVFEPIEFEPVLSAKELLSTQTFRTLFRSETVAASESLEVRDLTFLFTDLRDSTAMYERIGDASAYHLVRLHFDALEVVIREHGGAIVKTIGDAIMATFVKPAAGLEAALRMADRLNEFSRSAPSELVLKMGLHRGHAIAVTSNDVVDYFGQTVNIAARIQGLAAAGQVCLSEDVYRAQGVADLLEPLSVARDVSLIKGVAGEVPLYRVTLGQPD